MPKLRILITDDSVVIRKLVSEALAGDPDLEVAGTAANGKIALAKIPQVNPDLVTLDIEMPEMDGLETLAALRKTHPQLPVIMFSTLTERGASVTVEALSLGANDYVTKPSGVRDIVAAVQRVKEELIPKIKALCARKLGASLHGNGLLARPAQARRAPALTAQQFKNVSVVAIGVSTGGPNALAELLPEIPGNFPVPILIVQHMPPMFTKLLADRLAAKCAIKVTEAAEGDVLEPAHAWIAPGNYHMVVERRVMAARLQLNQAPHENSCRPAVDVLFRSVAEAYRDHTLAVILTGMGQDGLRGCEAISEASGRILVQDEASSVVWGMPGFVAKAGLAEAVLPLHRLGGEITRLVLHGRTAAKPSPAAVPGIPSQI